MTLCDKQSSPLCRYVYGLHCNDLMFLHGVRSPSEFFNMDAFELASHIAMMKSDNNIHLRSGGVPFVQKMISLILGIFLNIEILSDFNEGPCRVSKDHLISYLDRGGLQWEGPE